MRLQPPKVQGQLVSIFSVLFPITDYSEHRLADAGHKMAVLQCCGRSLGRGRAVSGPVLQNHYARLDYIAQSHTDFYFFFMNFFKYTPFSSLVNKYDGWFFFSQSIRLYHAFYGVSNPPSLDMSNNLFGSERYRFLVFASSMSISFFLIA